MSSQNTDDLVGRYNDVKARIDKVVAEVGLQKKPTLVAVSKTKPADMIQTLYDAGHRQFGENYAQELAQKAEQLPKDIEWSFIGHLQSNKAKVICGITNLCIETVDSEKLANILDKVSKDRVNKLRVFVQVNTSGEESKSGVSAEEAVVLARHVVENCPALELMGLMTIGSPDDTELRDFRALAACRDSVEVALGLKAGTLGLSMGMSGDFEDALRCGSTNIRVGSTIFGARG